MVNQWINVFAFGVLGGVSLATGRPTSTTHDKNGCPDASEYDGGDGTVLGKVAVRAAAPT